MKSVRENVGLIDVSTLGGLDIRGPDAAEFLNRMYTFTYAKLPVGKSRYVLMTDQSGAVIDDGVACRFHDEHFYVTATTSGVDGVYRLMLFWNAQWRLDVDIANVTAAYAGVNIAGPRSRQVLQRLCSDVDLSPDAFPYLGVRMGTVAGVPARLLRVGFVGELGYEIHMPAHYGEHVWDALMEAGQPFGIKPFGVEAQRVLRLEKGHIIIGQDTDGLTHPYEADMAWAISKTQALLHRPEVHRDPECPRPDAQARRLHHRGLGGAGAGGMPPHAARPRHRRPRHLGGALAVAGQDRRPRLCGAGAGRRRQAASTSRSMAAASSRARWCRSPSTIRRTSGRRCRHGRRLNTALPDRPARAAASSIACCSRRARASSASTTASWPWSIDTPPTTKSPQARRMGIADLSVLPRTGFKGAGTVEWLTSQGLNIGADSNIAYRQTGGELAARLAPTEIFLVDSLAATGRPDRPAQRRLGLDAPSSRAS